MSEPQMLHDLLDHTASRNPGHAALTAGRTTLSYRELAEATKRAAVVLREHGARRGDRMVITSADGLAVTVLMFAAARLGTAFTVLHEQVRGTPLDHVLDDCEPALIVSDDSAIIPSAEKHQVPLLPISTLLEAAVLGDAATLTSPELPASGAIGVDAACLIYTSGTTALPKAVVSTHEQMLFAASAIQGCLQYRDDDVVYCPLPLSFDYGLYQVLLAIMSGAHLQLGTAAEVGPTLLRRLEETGATVLPGVPSIADRLAWLLRRSRKSLGRLRLLTNTGAALSDSTISALRENLPDLRIQVMYGLTECKRAAIMPPDGDLDHPGSCGRPLPGTEISVIDDDGNPVPPGDVGQLVVRGPNVMAGYWRRPELTAERFHRRDGLFPELRTGDYGWLDKDGYLYFAGRRDDLYKERGFRLSTTEVEAAAHRIDGVRSAAVIPPEGKRPSVLAVVADLSSEEVLERMREEIELFKIPRRCVDFDALPTNNNGKTDRKKLAQLIEAGAGHPTEGS